MDNETIQINNNHHLLFTACCFDPRLKLGAASRFAIPPEACEKVKFRELQQLPFETEVFINTSPVRLELESSIWALSGFKPATKPATLTLLSRANAVKDLLQKREKLELSNYAGTKPGATITNAELYQQFYKLHDGLKFEVIWMGPTDEPLPLSNAQKNVFAEAIKRADTALKSKLKAENKVADKWF